MGPVAPGLPYGHRLHTGKHRQRKRSWSRKYFHFSVRYWPATPIKPATTPAGVKGQGGVFCPRYAVGQPLTPSHTRTFSREGSRFRAASLCHMANAPGGRGLGQRPNDGSRDMSLVGGQGGRLPPALGERRGRHYYLQYRREQFFLKSGLNPYFMRVSGFLFVLVEWYVCTGISVSLLCFAQYKNNFIDNTLVLN